MQANHDIIIIPLPFVVLNLEIVERKGKNYKKLNISRTKRAFPIKQKTFFVISKGLSFGEKKKFETFPP